MPREYRLDIAVRWGEMDAFGHVNNVAFFRYLEDARIRWLDERLGALRDPGSGPMIVNVNCNFRRELRYPATIQVRLEARAASEKRLLLSHTIVDRDDPQTVYADAEATLVWVDFSTRRSIVLPRRVLELLEA